MSQADQDKVEDVMDIFLKVKNYNSTSKKSKRKNDFEFLNKIKLIFIITSF